MADRYTRARKSSADFVNLLNRKRKKYNISMDFLFIGGIGGSELLLIVFVLLLLFGGKKLPELMKGLGRGIRDFKDAVNSETEQIKEMVEDKK